MAFRPVSAAHASTSDQFHAGLPPTVQRGSGSSSRKRHVSTVCRRTPSLSAISGMPTGSQSVMKETVANLLTLGYPCSNNNYMTQTTKTRTGSYIGTCSGCRIQVRTEERFVKHSCGAWITNYKEIVARVTEHECGVKCTSATGPTCDCKCGGANHSSDHH